MAIEGLVCNVCGAASLQEVPGFRLLPRITSDCVPFRDGGRLAICQDCNAAQSPEDEQWYAEIREIYSSYRMYYQSGGVEQHVRDPVTGLLRRRSEVLLDRLLALPAMPRAGNVLDVGCGTGGTLKAFSDQGAWCLYGLEMDERNLPFLMSIPGFHTLYTCSPTEVPKQFEVITMVHSLEHFPAPLAALRAIREKLVPGGRLLIQVPNAADNPFDYVVADHMLHFTHASLARLVHGAGFEVEHLASNWVMKELSLVARITQSTDRVSEGSLRIEDCVYTHVDWLHRFIDSASMAAQGTGPFGLFGTSIAATWLCAALGDRVSFFIEEDLNRVGRNHMGRPILSPSCAPTGSKVFIALIPAIASQVGERLSNLGIDLCFPPPIRSLNVVSHWFDQCD